VTWLGPRFSSVGVRDFASEPRVDRLLRPHRGLACASTLLLDSDGKIQFFYKGEQSADRPAAKKLIQFIEEMR